MRNASPACAETEPGVVVEMLARVVVAEADALATGDARSRGVGDAFAKAICRATGGKTPQADALAAGLRIAAALSVKECGLDAQAASALDDMLSDLGFSSIGPLGADAVALAFAGVLKDEGEKTVPLLADVAMPMNVPVTPARLQGAIRGISC